MITNLTQGLQNSRSATHERKILVFSGLLSLFFFTHTFADTFKCENRGVISYSDKPCDNPLPLQLPKASPSKDKAGTASSNNKNKYYQINIKLESARKKRAAERRIKSLKLQIEETMLARKKALKASQEQIDSIDYDNGDIDDYANAEAIAQRLKAEKSRIDNDFANKLKALNAQLLKLQEQVGKMNPHR